MQAIARYEQIAMTLPTYGDRGVKVQEDFFPEIDLSSIFAGRGYYASYHHDIYNPVTDGPEFHHYYCGNADCAYCAAVQGSLKDGNALPQMISFERFNEKYPYILNTASNEWYRDTPVNGFTPSQILYDSWLWQDEEEDESYDDYGIDTSDYTYGYKQGETSKHDRHMLRKINWRKLTVVGAGAYGITFTDGKYAIKVGEINRFDVQNLETAAEHGFSVPVHYYAKNRRVPAKLLQNVQTCDAYRFGSRVNWQNYVNRYTLKADIMVMGLAEPFLDHESCNYDEREAEAIVNRLRHEYAAATGNDWRDAHEGNMGYYNGALVILDF